MDLEVEEFENHCSRVIRVITTLAIQITSKFILICHGGVPSTCPWHEISMHIACPKDCEVQFYVAQTLFPKFFQQQQEVCFTSKAFVAPAYSPPMKAGGKGCTWI